MSDRQNHPWTNPSQLTPSPSQGSNGTSTSSNSTYYSANSITPGINFTPTESIPSPLSSYSVRRESVSSSSYVSTQGSTQDAFDTSSSSITSSSLRSDNSSTPATDSHNHPIIIIVMGPTGAGKSNFIKVATGNDDVQVGHSLRSHTDDINVFKCQGPRGREFHFVDTPGFDDTYRHEGEILSRIASWLLQTYQDRRMLSGVLYLHNITDNRMTNTRLQNLDIFKKICGSDAYSSVCLVSTHWDEIQAPNVGTKKEDELRRNYWKVLIDKKAKNGRFDNTYSSAWTIIETLSLKPRLLQIQDEMGNKKRPLFKTKAGQGLYSWLDRAARLLRNTIEKLKMARRKLSSETNSGSDIVQQKLEEEVAKADTKLSDIVTQQNVLRTK
ncbi:hypothetical protein D9756_003445 [Leucocoprinus leucothites]|uniref:G domain-containing protein n=1 Tax=Leucocoprinus leucothites TaxID=201217 RepID=A0A8H5G7L9_9AGAR|nr:hypothetical protein D9756_003445 [Leucoagaricus leucothites]